VIYGPSLRATRATFLSPHSDLSFRSSPTRAAHAAAEAAAADAPRDYDAEIEALASSRLFNVPPEPPLSRSVDSFAAPAQLGRTFASAGPGGGARASGAAEHERAGLAAQLAAQLAGGLDGGRAAGGRAAGGRAGGAMARGEFDFARAGAAPGSGSGAAAEDRTRSLAERSYTTLRTTQSSGVTQGGPEEQRRSLERS